MPLKFEVTCKSYRIEIEDRLFLDLLDSESYATDNAAFKPGAKTLLDKLVALPGVSDVEYNGHFGAAVYLTIAADDDIASLHKKIGETIKQHLPWCAALTKATHVIARRKAE